MVELVVVGESKNKHVEQYQLKTNKTKLKNIKNKQTKVQRAQRTIWTKSIAYNRSKHIATVDKQQTTTTIRKKGKEGKSGETVGARVNNKKKKTKNDQKKNTHNTVTRQKKELKHITTTKINKKYSN